MSSARSTVPGDGNGYRHVNRVVPPPNEPVSVPKLPKKPSGGIVVGGRLEGRQVHESTPQSSGSADWTNRDVQERAKSKNEPSSSYSPYPPNTRGGTNPNPVVAAHSSIRVEGPLASQPRALAQNDGAYFKVDEQRSTNELPRPRGYPTHRDNEEKENKAAFPVSSPMYGEQASSSPPKASTESSTQAPTPRTLPSNTPTHKVNVTSRDVAAPYTATPQLAAQRTTGFDHANTSSEGSRDRGNVYSSTIITARKNELGTYTSGTGASRSDAPSQNQNVPNSAPIVSRAPPLPPPTSRPNRRDEKLNTPSSLPLSSSVSTRDQLGSDSIITTTPNPLSKPSAPQLPQTMTYQNPSVSASTSQQRGITEERTTQERTPGNPQSGDDPPYAREHNLNAPANPTSQLGRSDEKKPNMPLSSTFHGAPKNFDQDYVGSGSTVASAGNASAPQPRKTWLSSYSSASATPQQPDTVEERTAQEPPSGNPTNVGSLYSQTRVQGSIVQSSSSNEASPPSSYPTPVSPTPSTALLYPTLAAITGGNSGSKQAKSKGNDFQATSSASQSNETRGQGVGRGGNFANTSVVVDVASSNAESSAGVQKRKGKSSEQDDGSRTVESFMTNYPSLDVTSELDVHSPFATVGLVDMHSGICRKRKVFVKVLRNYGGWRVDPHTGASSKPHITTEMPKWAALKHQNLCEFFGYSTRFGPYPALVYAWCGGDTAFEYLRDRHLRVEQRIRLAQDVAEGLQHLHENDIVHGNLTLQNVLVDDSGAALLCDFGLAQLAEWQQPIEPTAASNYSGSDRYRAPELSGGPASVATFESDIYSLGCILLKFIEELNPFDGVQDVAKQKRKTPPVPPARRKDKTDVLSGMTSFFWKQLEACWEDPAARPKIYKIVENLQTLANDFPLTQIEQVESPPPYPAPVPEPVDKTTLNYPSGSIPDQPPVEVAFSLGSTRDLFMGRSTPTRLPPRTEGSAGLSSFGQTSNASVYTHGSRGAGYQPSNASLHTQGSRAGGYELSERQFDAAGGSSMTRDEPPEAPDRTVAPRASLSRGHEDIQTRRAPPFESSDPSVGPGTRDPAPTESLLAVPARKPSSATMGRTGGEANSIRGGGGNTTTTTARGAGDKAKAPEGGGVSRTAPITPDDAHSGSRSCCVLC